MDEVAARIAERQRVELLQRVSAGDPTVDPAMALQTVAAELLEQRTRLLDVGRAFASGARLFGRFAPTGDTGGNPAADASDPSDAPQ